MVKIKLPEKLFLGLIIGGTLPLLIGMLSMIVWFYLNRDETLAPIYLVGGISIGVLLDLKYLKSWIRNRYQLPIWFIVGIYLFYNVCIFGFFMGFPVFNLLMGIPAGYYYGKRIDRESTSPEKQDQLTGQVSLFTAFVMTLICFSSGFIALAGNGVGKDVQSMLRLGFEVTRPMLVCIIVTGGILLIGLQYTLTRIILIQTKKGNC